MSRQNKQRRVIAEKISVTRVHKKSVQETGVKRAKQKKGKASVGFTKKLTSPGKGRCKVVAGKRVSINYLAGEYRTSTKLL